MYTTRTTPLYASHLYSQPKSRIYIVTRTFLERLNSLTKKSNRQNSSTRRGQIAKGKRGRDCIAQDLGQTRWWLVAAVRQNPPAARPKMS